MSSLVVDLNLILLKSKEHNNSFEELKSKIKTIPVGQFDAMAHPIVEEITSKIDCTQCGNCCKQQEPGVTMEENRNIGGYKKKCRLMNLKLNSWPGIKKGFFFMQQALYIFRGYYLFGI